MGRQWARDDRPARPSRQSTALGGLSHQGASCAPSASSPSRSPRRSARPPSPAPPQPCRPTRRTPRHPVVRGQVNDPGLAALEQLAGPALAGRPDAARANVYVPPPELSPSPATTAVARAADVADESAAHRSGRHDRERALLGLRLGLRGPGRRRRGRGVRDCPRRHGWRPPPAVHEAPLGRHSLTTDPRSRRDPRAGTDGESSSLAKPELARKFHDNAVRSLPEERAAEIAARTLALPDAQSVEDLTALLTSAGER